MGKDQREPRGGAGAGRRQNRGAGRTASGLNGDPNWAHVAHRAAALGGNEVEIRIRKWGAVDETEVNRVGLQGGARWAWTLHFYEVTPGSGLQTPGRVAVTLNVGLWPLHPSLGFVESPFGFLSLPQIRDFLQQLKNRVAREAIQKVHPGGLKGQRRRETQPPAPIEVRQGQAPWKMGASWEDNLVRGSSVSGGLLRVDP